MKSKTNRRPRYILLKKVILFFITKDIVRTGKVTVIREFGSCFVIHISAPEMDATVLMLEKKENIKRIQ